MTDRALPALAWILAVALGLEVWLHANWLVRVIALAPLYDGVVFAMAGLRAVVTALQAAAAWALWRQAPSAAVLGQAAFVSSAATLALEIGARLSPSNVTPGFRGPLVAGYAVYAAVMVVVLRRWGSGRRV